ncbi:MAG: response regulator [Acidobacteriia bacterium]|nr:response regulator [Terriglobia bacterium]
MNETRPKRVLVVDDEADVREYLQAALEDAGFLVETACDGLEALGSVRRNAPDLISLDLVMPHHSGARFYHDLQKDRQLSKIPVLIVTGHAKDELGRADFREMTMSGPGVYLEKPVRPDSYVKAVRTLLGMESSDAEMMGQNDELRSELGNALAGADRETLKRALEVLKKR